MIGSPLLTMRLPSLGTGLLPMLLMLTLNGCCFASAPNDLELYPASGAANTVVSLSGHALITSERMFCRVGTQVVSAERNLTSSGHESIVFCRIPQQSGGFHSVEVTHNGRDFTRSGLMFHHEHVIIFDVFPSIVNTAGGTLVRVRGVGFQNGFRCRGDVQSDDISAAFVSSSLILCETSALRVEDGTTAAHLSVVSSSNQRAQLSTQFTLTEDVARVKRVGVLGGNSTVDVLEIFGSGFDSNVASQVLCRIGTTQVSAQIHSSSKAILRWPLIREEHISILVSFNQVDFVSVAFEKRWIGCAHEPHRPSPPLSVEVDRLLPPVREAFSPWSTLGEAVVSERILPAETVDNLKSHGDYTLFEFSFSVATSSCGNSLDGVGFDAVFLGSHVDVQYYYVLIPTVRSIVPQYGESGLSQPFQILGKHFSAAMSACFSDAGEMFDGTLISSAMLSCELRGHTDGDVSFGVGRHKGYGHAGVVTYFTETPIKDISPSSGPEAGGTLVSIFALSARAPPPLLCRFGTIGPVAARHKSLEEIECLSSARRPGSVPFALSIRSRFVGARPSFSFLFVSWLHDPDLLVLSDSLITTCSKSNIDGESLPSASVLLFDIIDHSLCKLQLLKFGFVAVAISSTYGLQKPHTLWHQTAVFPPPSTRGFFPLDLVLGGGSIIHLRGKNMGEKGVESIQCMFGHGKSRAYTVSSTLSVCEVPAGTLSSMRGSVSVEATWASYRPVLEESSMPYTYFSLPRLHKIEPERGPSRGGTSLHIHGNVLSNADDLSCKVGTVRVQASFLNEHEAVCFTPSSIGSVLVDVSVNGKDGTGYPLVFRYS